MCPPSLSRYLDEAASDGPRRRQRVSVSANVGYPNRLLRALSIAARSIPAKRIHNDVVRGCTSTFDVPICLERNGTYHDFGDHIESMVQKALYEICRVQLVNWRYFHTPHPHFIERARCFTACSRFTGNGREIPDWREELHESSDVVRVKKR